MSKKLAEIIKVQVYDAVHNIHRDATAEEINWMQLVVPSRHVTCGLAERQILLEDGTLLTRCASDTNELAAACVDMDYQVWHPVHILIAGDEPVDDDLDSRPAVLVGYTKANRIKDEKHGV